MTTATDCWGWLVTEKTLHATGATASTDLRQTAVEFEKAAHRLDTDRPRPSNKSSATSDGATPPQAFGRYTFYGQYRNRHQGAVWRLSEEWLQQAGFDFGQKIQVWVEQNQLTIRAE